MLSSVSLRAIPGGEEGGSVSQELWLEGIQRGDIIE